MPVQPADSPMLAYVLAQLDARKQADPGIVRQIAAMTGIPFDTVDKIARRRVRDPSVSRVEKLALFFRSRRSIKTLEPRVSKRNGANGTDSTATAG